MVERCGVEVDEDGDCEGEKAAKTGASPVDCFDAPPVGSNASEDIEVVQGVSTQGH